MDGHGTPGNEPTERFVRLDEVARILGIHISTVHVWIKEEDPDKPNLPEPDRLSPGVVGYWHSTLMDIISNMQK